MLINSLSHKVITAEGKEDMDVQLTSGYYLVLQISMEWVELLHSVMHILKNYGLKNECNCNHNMQQVKALIANTSECHYTDFKVATKIFNPLISKYCKVQCKPMFSILLPKFIYIHTFRWPDDHPLQKYR